MAVVLGFRIAIALTPVVYRYVASGGSTVPGAYERSLVALGKDLFDYSFSAEELEAELNAGVDPEESLGWTVTDFTGTFELRKLQWRLSRAPSGGTLEDVDVCTFHFIKAAAGVPGAWVDGTDLPLVETALGTYWNSLRPKYNPWIRSDQFRWYKDGPAFWQLHPDGDRYVPIAPNPAIRVTEVDVAGSSTSVENVPPQCALTVTEITSGRRHWGRYYLPAPIATVCDGNGRIDAAEVTAWTGYAVTFYNACRAAGVIPVVYSIPKPARETVSGSPLPAVGGTAYEVISVQMDDLWDVIRRRRYGGPTLRVKTLLT